MAKLVEVALSYIYLGSLPERLFWIFDSTHTEKPHSKKVAGLKWFHRTKKVDGRAKNLKGHRYVFAAPLYRQTTGKMISWASVLTGALLYVKGQTIPQLVIELAKHLRLPDGPRHCWIVDRGVLCRRLLGGIGELKQFVIGRGNYRYLKGQDFMGFTSIEKLGSVRLLCNPIGVHWRHRRSMRLEHQHIYCYDGQ
jgi:hypothetical protein